MGYLGGVVEKTGGLLLPNRGDDSQGRKSSSVAGMFYKTVVFGGIVAVSYYLGKDSTKPHGVVAKMLGKKRVNKAKMDGCILHCYDHCPYSIKVELALAFLGVPYSRVLYGYGDMEGPKSLMGKKQLPVMEYMKSFTSESLDIIDMLDTNTAHRSIPPRTCREDLKQWLKEITPTRQDLTRPRVIQVDVKDWADQRDVRYAKKKYEKKGFNYRTAKARSGELIRQMNEFLEIFNDKILYDEYSVNEFGFGMDDIEVLPHLRTLTCVKGLNWPQKTRLYLENAFKDTDAELYFKYAN